MTPRLTFALFVAAALALPLPVWAQSRPVYQSGPIVPGHLTKSYTDGLIGDSGLSTTGVASAGTSMLQATAYGVVADGITSNDGTLATAVNACSAIGGALALPPGGILLTGTQSINLHDCHLIGQGVFSGDGQNFGSTILLVSQSVKPFICGSNWAVEGVNFYWPNQVSGTTVYPPLFADNGSVGCGLFSLDNVNIVNAYDVFTATGTLSWGAIRISNSQIYALNHFWKIANTGDFVLIANTILDPGVWLAMTGFSTQTNNAINAADQVNIMFDIGSGPIVSFMLDNVGAFAWRYGYLVRSGGLLGNGAEVIWDGVGTYVDTSAGGGLQNFTMTCPKGCVAGLATYPGGSGHEGNFPAFNLGATGSGALVLKQFQLGTAAGGGVVTAGQSVQINDSGFGAYGTKADGNEYYAVRATANTGGTGVRVQNSKFFPSPSIHNHGVKADVLLAEFTVQNSEFTNVNDAIDTATGSGNQEITGNISGNTQGSASILVSGTGQVLYANNRWDKPPAASLGACGGSPSISGAFAGFISVGSGSPATCAFTLPWVPYGGNGDCTFTASAGTVRASVGGTPPTWTLTPSSSSGQIFYNCPGQQ